MNLISASVTLYLCCICGISDTLVLHFCSTSSPLNNLFYPFYILLHVYQNKNKEISLESMCVVFASGGNEHHTQARVLGFHFWLMELVALRFPESTRQRWAAKRSLSCAQDGTVPINIIGQVCAPQFFIFCAILPQCTFIFQAFSWGFQSVPRWRTLEQATLADGGGQNCDLWFAGKYFLTVLLAS